MNAYNSITPETIQKDMRYLQLLSHSFPTIADASTEIINLEAILNLPKGTEHFLADLHGEYEAFQHVLRNASGAIKRKVNEIFGNTLRENEKKKTMYADLLSGTKTGSGKSSGNGPGRLVCHHVEPVGTCMPECILQIHPFQSAEITSQRILVYHSGVVARKLNGSQQAGVY